MKNTIVDTVDPIVRATRELEPPKGEALVLLAIDAERRSSRVIGVLPDVVNLLVRATFEDPGFKLALMIAAAAIAAHDRPQPQTTTQS